MSCVPLCYYYRILTSPGRASYGVGYGETVPKCEHVRNGVLTVWSLEDVVPIRTLLTSHMGGVDILERGPSDVVVNQGPSV